MLKARAVAALIASPSIVAAALICGSSERTIRRWLKTDRGFQRALADRLEEIVMAGAVVLARRMSDAVETLGEIMADVDIPPGHRIKAAATLLEMTTRHRETESLTRRLDKLEEVLSAFENSQPI